MSGSGSDRCRLDKWLWHARVFKTRTLAARQVGSGHVRINGSRVRKPAQPVVAGDVLTFAQGLGVRVVRVTAIGKRRGPASEAATLYDDLSPPVKPDQPPERIGARPTKRDRRALDALRRRDTEG